MSRFDQKIHDYLDGVITDDALSSDELAYARRFEAATLSAAPPADLRAPEDLAARVMAELPPAEVQTSPLADFFSWLWTPRNITAAFRPAYGFAAIAAAMLLIAILPEGPENAAPMVQQSQQVAQVYVQFTLEAPAASNVQLAGSFTDWQPSFELHRVEDGVWTAMVPLQPGVHDYTFVVDGTEWVTDPLAPQVDDSFGGTNSRLFLPDPGPAT